MVPLESWKSSNCRFGARVSHSSIPNGQHSLIGSRGVFYGLSHSLLRAKPRLVFMSCCMCPTRPPACPSSGPSVLLDRPVRPALGWSPMAMEHGFWDLHRRLGETYAAHVEFLKESSLGARSSNFARAVSSGSALAKPRGARPTVQSGDQRVLTRYV